MLKNMKKIFVIIIIFLFLITTNIHVSSNNIKILVQNNKEAVKIENFLEDNVSDNIWPMLCHDMVHSGRSEQGSKGDSLYEKWRIRFNDPIIISSPVISANGTIYIGIDGPGNDATLYAINPNGSIKWSYFIEKTFFGQVCDLTTPAIDRFGIVYVGSKNGFLYAINPNGTLKWKTILNPDPIRNGIISSPTIADDGTIYVGAFEKFYAVNPDGTEKWNFTTGNAIKSSAAIAVEGIIYISSHDGNFYALQPQDGSLKWFNTLGGFIYSSPSIDNNGIVYIGDEGCNLYAFESDGSLKWKFNGTGSYSSSFYAGPITGLNKTILITGDDKLWAIGTDGRKRWSTWMGEYYSNPAINQNDYIYMTGSRTGGSSSDLICLISENGDKIYNLKLETDEGDRIKWILTSPAIGSDGTVYIGSWALNQNDSSIGYVHAIGTEEKKGNKPPYKPVFVGPTHGKILREYFFTTTTVDPESSNVFYWFDWGDDSDGKWLGPYKSGISENIYHTWNNRGKFKIRVKARDVDGLESEWSDMDSISISNLKLDVNLTPNLNYIKKLNLI
jgi:outer membrane protein assembly factor BamB